jgi:hypothetical protein
MIGSDRGSIEVLSRKLSGRIEGKRNKSQKA